MRKILFIASFAFVFAFLAFSTETNANTVHSVKSGDTLWKIANQYGVPVNAIKNVNNKTSNTILVGERLQIPASISQADRDLLARLIRAEAEGGPYAGKVAVATVVLNRVDSHLFPNTVRGVIYEVAGGSYAFTPVQNGRINRPADTESRRAVEEALAFRGQGAGSLYFYNPRTSTSQWIFSRTTTIQIGNHVFAK